MTCKDIAARMITRDPDITRLLDRLERRRLLTRSRSKEDRRFVAIRIRMRAWRYWRNSTVPSNKSNSR